MKCKFCGTKIKKSDELCPECGKYSGEQKTTADMGKCLKKFSCNDNLPIFIFILLFIIFMLGWVIKNYINHRIINFETVAIIICGIFLLPMISWLCLKTFKSYICVCENGIYGAIPQKGSTVLNLRYDEIKAVGMNIIKTGKGGKFSVIGILTKAEEEYKIGLLNHKNAKLLCDMINSKLSTENPTQEVFDMKCKFCGAKIKKSDEVCPECGKYVAALNEKASENCEPERELGKNIKFFDTKAYASRVLYTFAPIGIIPIILGGRRLYRTYRIFEYLPEDYLRHNVMRDCVFVLLGLFIIGLSVCNYFAMRKSFVCVNENGVYGIKPRFLILTERFEYFYKDVKDFSCHIPPAQFGSSYITVKTDKKKYRINFLPGDDASFLATYTRDNMP